MSKGITETVAEHLAIRGIDANLGQRNADSFRADLHPDLKADFVPVRKNLANPPFNMSDWGGENLRQDAREYVAEEGIAEEEALKNGMEEKSREFTEKGSELYAKV